MHWRLAGYPMLPRQPIADSELCTSSDTIQLACIFTSLSSIPAFYASRRRTDRPLGRGGPFLPPRRNGGRLRRKLLHSRQDVVNMPIHGVDVKNSPHHTALIDQEGDALGIRTLRILVENS